MRWLTFATFVQHFYFFTNILYQLIRKKSSACSVIRKNYPPSERWDSSSRILSQRACVGGVSGKRKEPSPSPESERAYLMGEGLVSSKSSLNSGNSFSCISRASVFSLAAKYPNILLIFFGRRQDATETTPSAPIESEGRSKASFPV